LVQFIDLAVGVLTNCIDHFEAVVANDVENTSFKGFFKSFGGGVSVLYTSKSLLEVLVQRQGVNNSGLNPTVNDSFFFIDRVKQITVVNLLFDESIICLNFLVKLSLHHFVILNLVFISLYYHRLTVSLDII
jgi:hypothetical protein